MNCAHCRREIEPGEVTAYLGAVAIHADRSLCCAILLAELVLAGKEIISLKEENGDLKEQLENTNSNPKFVRSRRKMRRRRRKGQEGVPSAKHN